ncbi:MAG: glycosyltransferase family 39 protein [Saprospiraceae bacterium]|nr:glycosyltransferase family 39 protein [Saprospiraceae bacterium]
MIQQGILLLSITSCLFGLAFYFFNKNQLYKALFANGLGGFLLKGWCASDSFLHSWDERYHALVAKNLMKHPLRPTLYDTPLFPYDFTAWGDNHIWLSKQPLPLWAIAASMKVLGVNEWAVRLPSLVVGTLAIGLTFLIAHQLFGEKIAFIASFLHAIHGLTIEANAGRDSGDHIFTFFAFFIELGVYFALLSDKSEQKRSFSILTGVSMGCAFLCKWQPALLILPFWLASQSNIQQIFKNILPLSIAAFLVAAPWQFYIFQHFPTEAQWIFKAIFQPMTQPTQGHSGAWWYYIEQTRITFGEIIYLPMLWLLYVFYRTPKQTHIRLLTVWLFVPLILLSAMATKRQYYLNEYAPAYFILTAFFLDFLKNNKEKTVFSPIIAKILMVLLILLPIRYSIERVKPFDMKIAEVEKARKIKEWKTKLTNAKITVVFNTKQPIETMFYHNIVAAYMFLPSQQQVDSLLLRGYIVAVGNDESIPAELNQRTDIQFLENHQ